MILQVLQANQPGITRVSENFPNISAYVDALEISTISRQKNKSDGLKTYLCLSVLDDS